jgi:hypothetical protein
MSTVNDVFVALKSTSGKLDKENILRNSKNIPHLKEVIFLALDPNTQFYIRKIPKYTPNSTMELGVAIDKLVELSSRRVTGNAAIIFLSSILGQLSPEDALVIERIIQKDLDCGVDTTANKVWPGLIPEWPVMLATPTDDKVLAKMEYPAIAQLKMDAMRCNAVVKNGKVEFRSRNGKLMDLLGNLEEEFIALAKTIDDGKKNLVFDGEAVVFKNGKPLDRKTSNGIMNKAVKGTISQTEADSVHIFLWDVIPCWAHTQGKFDLNYESRFKTLQTAKLPEKIHCVESQIVKTLEEAQEVFEAYYAKGEEGIILKNPNSPWEDKRSKGQIKFKGEEECDLIVVDWVEGNKKYTGKLGALVCESSDGVVQVNVGSGFSDDQRDKYTKKNTVGKIVSVKYNCRIKDKKVGSKDRLFLPRFLEVRIDKDKADHSKIIK